MNNDDDTSADRRIKLSKISRRSDSDARTLNCSICSFESFEYYPDEGTYQALFDPGAITPSEAVVGVISEAEGVDPLDVERLGSKIDVEALDALITNRRPFEGDVHVSFTLNGYDVSLSSYGSLMVQPQAPTRT